MIKIKELTLEQYLKEKDIYVQGFSFKPYRDEDEYMQVEVIAYVHKALMSYPRVSSGCGNCIIGKLLEDYKVLLKKFIKSYEKIKSIGANGINEEFILREGKEIINKSEETFKNLDYVSYIDMIKRSMVRNEITLSRVDSTNLRVVESVEIGNINKIAYNVIEEDVINYILKLRKKREEIDEDRLINRFINSSRVDFTSGEYIKGMLNYPVETLKALEKYRQNKKCLEEEEYHRLLYSAFESEFK